MRSGILCLAAAFSTTMLAVLPCVTATVFAQAVPPAPTAAPAFRIAGAIAKPESLTLAALEARFGADIRTISYESKDKSKHTARALPLLTLLQSAGPTMNPNIKHHELQFIVAVRGFDGYAVDFSYAELLPTIGNRNIWIVLDQDGKPFAGEDGPIGLIAADDVKPARWVHGVTTITVIDSAAAFAAK